ncbi:amidohydrolase [Kineobactrum sediminis]|uniref:Amidohydrolase n=1 Tax=Kineobactrum sediminis TaxID=1905677 RepID=A0A2N5Y467_9GAMM|nr:amidohydrolase [Kineobactrum sediminis]PLW83179.1 amidohydrolase [Kineobactrum sediminis]
MRLSCRNPVRNLLLCLAIIAFPARAEDLSALVTADYERHLGDLFLHFHQNPELSGMEHATAARLAQELRSAGFEVSEGVGGTGIVALMENGPGPLVMMRADMDGLPVEEKSGLPYASRAKQVDESGQEVFVMHACGHDVHITSLVGTARLMAAQRDQWSGTLMLIGQPAEERIVGARTMMEDNIWERFGQPDYALAFHVAAQLPAGRLGVTEDSPYSGADTVDIIVHGIGAHGASPHQGVDPVVLGSQIVLALQTVVSRELPPRDAGVITVGAFNAGSKHNIISDRAHLQLTVRNDDLETRNLLLAGIKRIAENMGRVAGLPEDKLPEVIVAERESVPPTINDAPLTRQLRETWGAHFGEQVFQDGKRKGMGAEDFGFFTTDPYIPSTYFAVGGTPPEHFAREAAGGEPVPSHHSPLFKITPEPAITLGVEATVVALKSLLQAPGTQ